jgi:hypothetical protein
MGADQVGPPGRGGEAKVNEGKNMPKTPEGWQPLVTGNLSEGGDMSAPHLLAII